MIKKLIAIIGLCAVAGCGQKDSVGDGGRVIYTDANGRVVTAADLSNADGSYKWQVEGGKSIPPKAKELHEQARALGSSGNLEAAAKVLVEAAGVAPDWAYPTYDLAYTYLLMGKRAEALENYEKVERLEPRGFFTAKTALWALRKEKDGTFPAGTYDAYLKIEWAKESDKLALARKILETAPNYAPALKECALFTEDSKEQAALLAKALAAQPDAETYGILMINKATWLNNTGKREEAIKILGDLVLSPDSTFGTVAMAKSVMRFVVEKRPSPL